MQVFISNNRFLLTDKDRSPSFPRNVTRFSWTRKWVSATCTHPCRCDCRPAYVNQMLFQSRAQTSSCTAHYHDINLFFIHDLTYKARTLTVQHWQTPGDQRACQAWALVFHNTTSRRMSLGHHFTGLLWGTCLNGSHCKCICHPLFCGSFWQCPKVS